MLDTFADLSPARVVQGSEPLTIETCWQAHGRFGKYIYIYISCSIDIFLRPALLTKLKKFSMHKIHELSVINPSIFYCFTGVWFLIQCPPPKIALPSIIHLCTLFSSWFVFFNYLAL